VALFWSGVDTLHQPEPQLWLPIGGKLTTARVDAVRIVDAVAAEGGGRR